MNIEDFFTDDLAEAGVKMPLPKGQWIEVCGVGSKVHAEAKAAHDKAAIKAIDAMNNPTDEEKIAAMNANLDDIIVAVSKSWSFETEFNDKNVRALFSKSAWIKDKVNSFAGNPENFLPKN